MLFFANGGSSYLASQKDMVSDSHYHCLSLDWAVDIGEARKQLGADVPVQGNIDPSLLLGSVEEVEKAVKACIEGAGGPGMHVLNLGMGCCSRLRKGTRKIFVDAARKWGTVEASCGSSAGALEQPRVWSHATLGGPGARIPGRRGERGRGRRPARRRVKNARRGGHAAGLRLYMKR